MPSNMLIVFIGTWAPRSAMMSKRSLPTNGSRQWRQNSRTLSSSSATRRGREHRDMSTAMDGVVRRILEDEHARRQLDVRPDELEDPALRPR